VSRWPTLDSRNSPMRNGRGKSTRPWFGGWVWRDVASGLREMGHTVTTHYSHWIQVRSPAPEFIPAETENQPRTLFGIGATSGGHFRTLTG
jgi:hypothetical protein